ARPRRVTSSCVWPVPDRDGGARRLTPAIPAAEQVGAKADAACLDQNRQRDTTVGAELRPANGHPQVPLLDVTLEGNRGPGLLRIGSDCDGGTAVDAPQAQREQRLRLYGHGVADQIAGTSAKAR